MEVQVRMTNGDSVMVPILPDMSIGDVRQQLHQRTGRPLDSIRLLWAGSMLDDLRTIRDYGLMSATMLFMISSQLSAQIAEPQLQDPQYYSWPVNMRKLFVLCERRNDSATAFVHGDDPVGRVQRGKVRPQCYDCRQETILLQGAFEPQNMGELLAAIGRESPLRAECFNPECGSPTGRVWIDIRCGGDLPDGHTCNAKMKNLKCALLPQVVAASATDEDVIYGGNFDEDEPVIKFDPCGHLVSLEAFVQSVQTAIAEGEAHHGIRQTSLGHFCLSCPVRAEGCGVSFVHDFRHYKLGGQQQYRAMKDIAMARSVPQDTGGPAVASNPVSRIQETITQASIMPCPNCHAPAIKNDACTHMETCPCQGGRWCYFCGISIQGVRGHNANPQHDPATCFMYLHRHPLCGGNGWQSLQTFHRLRGVRMLHELRVELGAAVFDEALARAPAMLEDLFAQVERGTLFMPGTRITLEEIVNYSQQFGYDQAKECWYFSQDHVCIRMP